jgi:hypothetical protein
MEVISVDKERVEAGFRKSLDGHGYSFQNAVVRIAESLLQTGSLWRPLVPEFGVEVRGRDTRIDFILQRNNEPQFLICECKRANPATANWCFARACGSQWSQFAGVSTAEVIRRLPGGLASASLRELLSTDKAYQIALEVRTHEGGDQHGRQGRGEIEDAATQVCRGLNGFVEFLVTRLDLLPVGAHAVLVPVIFTTAQLWTSEIDLGTADIETGRLPAGKLGLQQRDWVWLDYPQSTGLKHSVRHEPVPLTPHQSGPQPLARIFYAELMRKVAVVSPSGLTPFLTSALWGPWLSTA